MKTLKYILLIGFAAQFINAQSIVIGTGSTINVGLGADICATAYGNITGTLTGDGTQCGSSVPEILNLVALIEGFYNGATMVSDVVTVQMRNSSSPYTLVEEEAVTLSTSGTGTGNFTSTLNATPYYMVVKHRNSIETWSKLPQQFTGGALTYDFTTAATQAYGDNLVLKSGEYCIWSGDVNGSGTINVTDINTVYAASNLGQTGYVITDVNGSNSVNVTDINITYANSNLGVSVQKPTVILTGTEVNPVKVLDNKETE